MKKKDHSIRNNVVATLIAAAIIAFVKPLRNLAISFTKWFWGILVTFFGHLTNSVSVPWWGMYIFIIIALILIALVGLIIVENLKGKSGENSLKSYLKDEFHGIVWRWRYGQGFQPYNVTAYCPQCDMQIYPSSPDWGDTTYYNCDQCGYKSQAIHIEMNFIDEWVEREIQRQLRKKAEPAVRADTGQR